MQDVVRLRRWKAATDPVTALSLARHINGGAALCGAESGSSPVWSIVDQINLHVTAGGEWLRSLASWPQDMVREFETHAESSQYPYAVDFWQFNYGHVLHAAVVIAEQTPNPNLADNLCANGRALGNHLPSELGSFEHVFYTTSRNTYGGYRTHLVPDYLLDPDSHEAYSRRFILGEDIAETMDVDTVCGPTLDSAAWTRVEPGLDLNFDVYYPDGLVHGVYNLHRKQ